MAFFNENGALVVRTNGETLRIEAWGENSLRVRSTKLSEFSDKDWALTEKMPETMSVIEEFTRDVKSADTGNMYKENWASIRNGNIRAEVNFAGVLSFFKITVNAEGREEEKLILREYFRSYGGTISKESRCLKIVNREWKGIIGGSEFSLNLKFESNEGEKLYGMGQSDKRNRNG